MRLIEPQAGKTYQSSLRAEAQVEVPEGERLDRVELYLNDDKLATLYQPPYTQALLLPKGKEITYVRAVAYLDGGNSTEDLVLVNCARLQPEGDVQFVELYTSVVDAAGAAGRRPRQGGFHGHRGRRSSRRSAASSGCATCRSTPASCSTPRPR